MKLSEDGHVSLTSDLDISYSTSCSSHRWCHLVARPHRHCVSRFSRFSLRPPSKLLTQIDSNAGPALPCDCSSVSCTTYPPAHVRAGREEGRGTAQGWCNAAFLASLWNFPDNISTFPVDFSFLSIPHSRRFVHLSRAATLLTHPTLHSLHYLPLFISHSCPCLWEGSARGTSFSPHPAHLTFPHSLPSHSSPSRRWLPSRPVMCREQSASSSARLMARCASCPDFSR